MAVAYPLVVDLIAAIHCAARRYCTEREQVWHDRYAELNASDGGRQPSSDLAVGCSAAAYDIFPRYQVLAAIRTDVERCVPENFATLEEARTYLQLAAETARSQFTEFEEVVAIAAVWDERRLFAEFVATLEESQLATVPPLPFRRVLRSSEDEAMHVAFVKRWGKWYGGKSDRDCDGADVVTLDVKAMTTPDAYEHLRSALLARGLQRIFELRECSDGFELDTVSAGFKYNGEEGFWTGHGSDWMVYASHESSITFGGDWLIDRVRRSLPLFDRYLYRAGDLSEHS